MSPLAVSLTGLIVMLVLTFLKLPLAFALGLTGFVGIWYLRSLDVALQIAGMTAYSSAYSYTASCMPLFVLMGFFAAQSGIGKDLFSTAQKWVGHLPGGLAIATILGIGGFSTVTGSSMGTVATFGKVAYPEMRKYGYPETLAGGCIAAGGSVGGMIPPSTIIVIAAVLVEQSVGKLLIAGLGSGVLEVISYAAIIYVLAAFRPGWAPPATSSPWSERFTSLKKVWPVLVIFMVSVGGIYAGIMTPTEAAAVGAFATFVLAVARRGLTWGGFKEAMLDSAVASGMILIIIASANIFNYFITLTRLPMQLSEGLVALTIHPYAILGLVILLYLLLGCVMSSMAMVILTLPIIYPIMVDLGFDPIWFIIFALRMKEIAVITPPVGMNVFVLKAVVPNASLATLFKGIVPFFLMDLMNVVLLIAFPAIITFLPSLMR